MSDQYHEFGPFRRSTTIREDARLTITERDPERIKKWGTDPLHAHLPHDCDEWTIGEGDEDELIARLAELRESIDEAIEWLKAR